MTPRELVQRRATDAAGRTVWAPQGLLRAVREGKLAVLDGVHRNPGLVRPGACFFIQKPASGEYA